MTAIPNNRAESQQMAREGDATVASTGKTARIVGRVDHVLGCLDGGGHVTR